MGQPGDHSRHRPLQRCCRARVHVLLETSSRSVRKSSQAGGAGDEGPEPDDAKDQAGDGENAHEGTQQGVTTGQAAVSQIKDTEVAGQELRRVNEQDHLRRREQHTSSKPQRLAELGQFDTIIAVQLGKTSASQVDDDH